MHLQPKFTDIYIYKIKDHYFLNLKIYKRIKNCVAEFKNIFLIVNSVFDMNYKLVYIYICILIDNSI